MIQYTLRLSLRWLFIAVWCVASVGFGAESQLELAFSKKDKIVETKTAVDGRVMSLEPGDNDSINSVVVPATGIVSQETSIVFRPKMKYTLSAELSSTNKQVSGGYRLELWVGKRLLTQANNIEIVPKEGSIASEVTYVSDDIVTEMPLSIRLVASGFAGRETTRFQNVVLRAEPAKLGPQEAKP